MDMFAFSILPLVLMIIAPFFTGFIGYCGVKLAAKFLGPLDIRMSPPED